MNQEELKLQYFTHIMIAHAAWFYMLPNNKSLWKSVSQTVTLMFTCWCVIWSKAKQWSWAGWNAQAFLWYISLLHFFVSMATGPFLFSKLLLILHLSLPSSFLLSPIIGIYRHKPTNGESSQSLRLLRTMVDEKILRHLKL